MFCIIMQDVYNVNKEILHFYISFTFITFITFSAKKLDNRNQVKIKKISMIFHGFYCTLKIPEEKALFFRVV